MCALIHAPQRASIAESGAVIEGALNDRPAGDVAPPCRFAVDNRDIR